MKKKKVITIAVITLIVIGAAGFIGMRMLCRCGAVLCQVPKGK